MQRKPPLPANEHERLQALYDLRILDTEPEDRFDNLVCEVKKRCDVPIAVISLIDKDRQWFKSCVGLDIKETTRDVAFCAYAILNDEPLIIQNALLDPRFAENPLVVGPPYIRFYTGFPIRSPEGQIIGTLCIIDTKPRILTPYYRQQLEVSARIVEWELSQIPEKIRYVSKINSLED